MLPFWNGTLVRRLQRQRSASTPTLKTSNCALACRQRKQRNPKLKLACVYLASCTLLLLGASQEQAAFQRAQCGYLQAHGIAPRQLPRPHLVYAPRRNHHVRVPLPYKLEDGMGDFLPPAALKVIAEDYQQRLLDRLNDQIKGALFQTSCGVISVSEIFRADRHEARKSERRTNRHLDRNGREPNACVQLREPGAQQLIFPAPHRTFSIPPTHSNNSQPLQKPPKAPAQNHESALTSKSLNTERTQMLGANIAVQLGSLADLKTNVAAAAQGMHSGGGAGGFIWFVTDALGRLGVVATYGAGTLLVADRRQSLAPDGIELGGIYEPSTLPPSSSSSSSPSSSTTRASAPAQTRTLSTSARTSVQRPPNV